MPKGVWKYELTGREWVAAHMYVDHDECVLWERAITWDGYPDIRSQGRNIRGHRLAMEMHVGRVLLSEEQVLHSCDTPICVNLKHLRIGDNTDNVNDRTKRDRLPRGSKHHNTQFTEQQVLDIRDAYKTGARPCDLARELAVSLSQIENIIYRRTWVHV